MLEVSDSAYAARLFLYSFMGGLIPLICYWSRWGFVLSVISDLCSGLIPGIALGMVIPLGFDLWMKDTNTYQQITPALYMSLLIAIGFGMMQLRDQAWWPWEFNGHVAKKTYSNNNESETHDKPPNDQKEILVSGSMPQLKDLGGVDNNQSKFPIQEDEIKAPLLPVLLKDADVDKATGLFKSSDARTWFTHNRRNVLSASMLTGLGQDAVLDGMVLGEIFMFKSALCYDSQLTRLWNLMCVYRPLTTAVICYTVLMRTDRVAPSLVECVLHVVMYSLSAPCVALLWVGVQSLLGLNGRTTHMWGSSLLTSGGVLLYTSIVLNRHFKSGIELRINQVLIAKVMAKSTSGPNKINYDTRVQLHWLIKLIGFLVPFLVTSYLW